MTDGPRYHHLARVLLESPDPQTAIAHLLGDHEARLDILGAKVEHLECVIGKGQVKAS